MRGVQITIRGKTYQSMTLAAKDIGVGREAIRRAREEGRLDRVGLTRRGRGRGLEVKLGDQKFPSIAEASRRTGMSYWKLYTFMRAA
jgi:hypothetical protein